MYVWSYQSFIPVYHDINVNKLTAILDDYFILLERKKKKDC